jgi:dihydroxyacetone kinase-like predicted kinase
MAAEQCAPLTEKQVRVVPTTTVPQGVSALAYMEPDQSADELDAAFRETAESVHTALITYAARDSEYDGQIIKAGEHLVLLDGKLLGSYPDVEPLFEDLNRAFEPMNPEFLTIYFGADVTVEDAEEAKAVLGEHFPDADISVVDGGQPVYYYMISAE